MSRESELNPHDYVDPYTDVDVKVTTNAFSSLRWLLYKDCETCLAVSGKPCRDLRLSVEGFRLSPHKGRKKRNR